MKKLVLLSFLVVLCCAAFFSFQQHATNRVYFPVMAYHHYPADEGMTIQPVWGVQSFRNGTTVRVYGSVPSSCSQVRYGIDYVRPNLFKIVLWSVRPDAWCFDTLTPIMPPLEFTVPMDYKYTVDVFGVP